MSWADDFDPVDLTVHQAKTVKTTTNRYKELAEFLELELPSDGKAGRYKAMVKSKLEECAMLSSKCISRTQEW